MPKLQNVDVLRLSGGASTAAALKAAQQKEQAQAVGGAAVSILAADVAAQRKGRAVLDAAKARFLNRKALKLSRLHAKSSIVSLQMVEQDKQL